jgi:hypothetical protein
MTPTALLTLLLLSAALPGDERLAVLAIADPPGPEAELVELTHQLRAACRDREAGVLDVAELRARLLGQASTSTLPELERAYAGAMATYQAGEYPSTIRTLRAVIEDLEKLPESPEAYAQWVRAELRLAHAELTVGRRDAYREALERVAAVEPRVQADPDQFSPTFRRDLDAARARVAARPKRRVTVHAVGGWSANVFVNGKPAGTVPVALELAPGRYRIGGAAGALRVPSLWVQVTDEPRSVVLDFALAEALRVNAGPGLAVAEAERGAALVATGAWLAADRVLATSIASEDRVQFLVGSLYDVRRGAILRQGRVRMSAGAVPAASVGALAAFLLTGQPSQAVVNSTPANAPASSPTPVPILPPPAAPTPTVTRASVAKAAATATPTATATGTTSTTQSPTATLTATTTPTAAAPTKLDLRPATPKPALGNAPGTPPASVSRPWLKPAAYGSAVLALGLGALTAQQGFSARNSYQEATRLVRPDGTLQDAARYRDLVSAGDSARRNAWIGATASLAFAAGAGVLGYLAWTDAGAPAVRF